MDELLSLALSLQPIALDPDRTEFPRWWGQAAQAALLEVLNQRDAALALELHDESGLRPYTVSNLMGRFARANGAPLMDQVYWLRWTGLTEPVSATLGSFAEAAAGQTLELDHVPFRVLAAASQPHDQPWAGSASYAALSRDLLSPNAPRQVTFQLTSPTVFKDGGLLRALPTASLVFSSLLETWNAFSPITFLPELRRYAEECLALSRFELKSCPLTLKEGGLQIGAVGQVTFTAIRPDKFWLRQIHTLAAFAQFSGLGAGTAQGLGQARMIHPK
jgi:CRISPR-associated endoribonuclease Cas6